MKTELVRVTPALAREYLKKNTQNRPLRPGVVDGLIAAFKRGEYQLTHQGIAFDKDGNLVDGQHRLVAISRMPEDFSLMIMVTTGLPKSAFTVVDIGVKRSASDLLNISKNLASVARFMATIVEPNRSAITPQLLIPYVEGVESTFNRLVDAAPRTSKMWSSAVIRSAAILQMMVGRDEAYVLRNYRALTVLDYNEMSPIVRALASQGQRGTARGSDPFDMFHRAFKAFDPVRSNLEKIQINDSGQMLAAAKSLVRIAVLHEHR